jgi:alpha-L-rhamnosidase
MRERADLPRPNVICKRFGRTGDRFATVAVLVLAIMSASGFVNASPKTAATGLRCEYLDNPLGIDVTRPHLSWRLESDQRGQRQTAYQVLVAGNLAELRANHGDLWDSGKVSSDETLQIEYAGKPLQSRQQCSWKVRVWDQAGKTCDSEPAQWEMGLLEPGDWQAKWIARTTDKAITSAPLLRRGFRLDAQVRQARAYVCGLGYFELYLNGQRVGEDWLDPGYTRYDRRMLYLTYDVTRLLHRGDNATGVILGNGWFNVPNKAAWDFDRAPWRAAPRLLCQIEVEFTDGRRTLISSEADWKCAESPILYNTIYSGEVYDARREQPGWNQAAFDDSMWSRAQIVESPKGVLSAQMMPAIQTDRAFDVQRVTEPKPGIYVFDFGQNLSGHAELQVRGPAGARIEIQYAERLATNGLVDQDAIAQHLHRFDPKQPFQTDTYILKGQGLETWHSRFSYYGFRYVQVVALPEPSTKAASGSNAGSRGADLPVESCRLQVEPTPALKTATFNVQSSTGSAWASCVKLQGLRAIFFHSAVPEAGRFECSNPLLNRIWEATRRSYLGNLQGIPTDCPHREKNGWTGDAHLAAEQGMFNFFPAAVYTKWIQDLADEQQPDGRLPGIVPTGGWGYQWGNGPAWDSALLLIPYYQYVYYGDTELFRRHYESIKRYVDYLTSRATNGVVNIGLNDWAPFETKTEAGITDTAYYYMDARIVALAAKLLGKAEDARRYQELAGNIKAAFNEKFYRPDSGLYDNGSQTALSCAIYQGLVEPTNQPRVLSNLVAAVERRNWHIDAGILGAKYLLNSLTENGRADVAYRIASQKDLPSWGWWIEQGATTLWEEWNGSASRFHVMYGDIAAWFYKALCGINPDPAAPGFKHFFIKPNVIGDLAFARGQYDSIRGRIVSDWKVVNGEFQLNLTIPANTSATVSLPISVASQVQESGKPAGQGPGIRFVCEDAQRSVFEVESGTYHLRGPIQPLR